MVDFIPKSLILRPLGLIASGNCNARYNYFDKGCLKFARDNLER